MKGTSLVVFDLDGVIYRGNMPLPYAKETISALRGMGKKIYFLTNNSTRTRFQYQRKIARMGIQAKVGEIMTSAWGTALYLKGEGARKALVIGEEGLKKELRWAGIELVKRAEEAEYVVVGLDRGFNYRKLCLAFKAVRMGAKFIATNRDSTFPSEDGIVPGGGSIVASLETALGIQPLLIGKPSPFLLNLIMDREKVTAEEMVVVGDRLDTDIKMAKSTGTKSILVLTGVITREEALASPIKPDATIENLRELLDIDWLIS